MEHLDQIKVPQVQAATTNSLMKNLYKMTSYGRTDNGALTFTRSGSLCLDFFAQAGAMRRDVDGAVNLFKGAFAEDRQAALRTLFYLRDIRGGQGERRLFRKCLTWLGTDYLDVFKRVIKHVPEYGRWDDLFFQNEDCFDLIKDQLALDQETEYPSLLGKWLPTSNASSNKTRLKARAMYKGLGMREVEYRKTVRALRVKIKTVEEKMSARQWGEINYSTVPSQAAKNYRNAFKKHDAERYNAFVTKATTGEVKINAQTLYPHQIYQAAHKKWDQTLEALWNQLPDYTRGENAIVVADVSGSMYGEPISVSVSLALYFAERNKGQFKDHFITFSRKPTLQKIQGETLLDKMHSIDRAHWDMNTDLEAVYMLLLHTAKVGGSPAEDMPSTIYIISDMQFDQCITDHTHYDNLKDAYAHFGYKLPNVVFWNVNAKGRNLPVQKNENGVAMVSGYSPSIFKMVTEGKTPEQVMLDTINSERYARIKLVS